MPDIENPTSEQIKTAMLAGTPVEYDGNEYARITAYIYRISERDTYGKRRAFMQAIEQNRQQHRYSKSKQNYN